MSAALGRRMLVGMLVAGLLAVGLPCPGGSLPAAGASEPGTALGATGNLSEQVFAVVPGTTLEPAHNSMLISNESTKSQDLSLVVEPPAGMAVDLSQPDRLHVEAGGIVAVSVDRIIVAPHVAPGEYRITVRALAPEPETAPGEVKVVPGVTMTARVEVTGEAATLIVVPTNSGGKPIAAATEIAYGSGGRWTTICTGTGKLSRQVAAGRYRVTVRLGGRILASKTLVLREGQSRRVMLPVETLAFINFAPVPVRRSGRIVYYEFRYDLENRLEELPAATVRLEVTRDGKLVLHDEQELRAIPTGLTGGKFVYIPDASAQGYGDYQVRAAVVRGHETLASSRGLTLEVSPQSLAEWARYGVQRLLDGAAGAGPTVPLVIILVLIACGGVCVVRVRVSRRRRSR